MVILEFGNASYVVTKEKAFELIAFLEAAEVYTSRYKDGGYTHHVYPNETLPTMKILPDSLYQMAKLAGKPDTPY